MTDSEVLSFIVPRFDTIWTYTPIEYANNRLETEGLPEWARLTVKPSASRKIGFDEKARRFGTVHIQVFVRIGTGQGRPTELAVLAGEIFGGVISGSLVFDSYIIHDVGESVAMGLNTVKSGWYQMNVSIDYSFID